MGTPSYINDGWCDGENNNVDCGHDGDDCCLGYENIQCGFCIAGANCMCFLDSVDYCGKLK